MKYSELILLVLLILIVRRKRSGLTKQLLLERVAISSNDKCLLKLLDYESTGIRWNSIFAISQGSFHGLGNNEGSCQNDLSSFRDGTANIISRWKPSFILTCTIKTIPALTNLNDVRSFGMLGGVSITNIDKSKAHGEYQEKFFDGWNRKDTLVDSKQG